MSEYDDRWRRPEDDDSPENAEERYDNDDDVPFRLPLAEGVSIYKDDTEDIVIPDEPFTDETIRRESTEELEALRAEDRPLEPEMTGDGPPVLLDGDDDMSATVPHAVIGDGDEDVDVPFHLPRSEDGGTEYDGPVPNKFVTMPNRPRHNEPTLPGSGGLDPNPDFKDMTVQHQPVVRAAAPAPAPRQQVQRPQPVQRGAARPPMPPARPAVPPAPPAQQGKVGQRSLPRRRKRRLNPGCLAIFIGLFVTFCGGLTLVTAAASVYAYIRVGDLLDEAIRPFDDYQQFQSTFLYDRNGNQLYEVFGEGRRTYVDIEEIPQYLIDATIAIEDDSFYGNIGIDVGATMVALMQYVGASSDETTPGGSTITQQLVRNVLFDYEYRAERSVQRKVEEILYAVALNQRLDKDEILELYMNEIYYGNLAYGVEAASQVFFSKNVSELTLGEAALLAGLPQAPSELDPLDPDPEVRSAVETRWRQVLNEMVEEGYITSDERNEALRAGLSFNPQDVDLRAAHFSVYALSDLERVMSDLGYGPEQIALGGLRVFTTVDVELDERTQAVAREQVQALTAQGRNVGNAAVVILHPITGEILAMVGSIDYYDEANDGSFNVVTGLRQPGSTIKAFTYAAAVEQGMTPGDVIWDTRTSIAIPGQPAYEPVNYDRGFHGPMRMRYALANSYNIPAVQTLRRVTVPYLLNFLERFGVETMGTDASQYGLSLTLGGGEISPLELASGFAVFANDGVLVEPQSILCVLDREDNVIYQFENGCTRAPLVVDGQRIDAVVNESTVSRSATSVQVLDPRIAFLISDILADNGARSTEMGSNSALYTPGITTSVKTGTSGVNEIKDNWTMGYTRNVMVGVWVGNNDGDPLINSSGLTGAAPIWNQIMRMIYDDNRYLGEFAESRPLRSDQIVPPGAPVPYATMTYRQICNVRTLQDPANACVSTINEWFLDSPAGLPDGQGGLNYPPPGSNDNPLPASGSYVQEVEPGIYRTVVYRLPEPVAAAIQFPVAPGERQPPAPLYCRVPVEMIPTTPGATEQFFIPPPPVQTDAVEAEFYARSAGLAFLPTIECSPELIAAGGSVGGSIVTAYITSPQPNQTVTDVMPIIGTVQFTPEQASFYKVEIIGGQFANWQTIGDIHYNSVVNDQLEVLYVPGLQPGNYRLRLVVIGLDGNRAQDPYEVSFNVP